MNKISKLGIPYMGSKRSIAKNIVDTIIFCNPNVKYIYDLFGGGGAISFEFLQRKNIKKVIYNELNTGVTELLKYIQKNGVTPDFYNWIDRETFHKYYKDNTWFGGLIKTCWSFGNNQKSYLHGKEIEMYKKNYHLVVVNNENRIKEMCNYIEKYVFEKYKIKEKCILTLPIKKTIHERRLEIRRQIVEYQKKCKLEKFSRLKQLEQLQQLQQLQQLEQLEQFSRLQQVEQLEQLERLQQVERSEQLEIQNKSFENVKIDTPMEETIIYLDPPYKNTSKYQIEIDHEFLNEYIKNSKYKIYISSYQSKFFEIESFIKTCVMSQKYNNKVIEKLFCNREEAIKKPEKIIYKKNELFDYIAI